MATFVEIEERFLVYNNLELQNLMRRGFVFNTNVAMDVFSHVFDVAVPANTAEIDVQIHKLCPVNRIVLAAKYVLMVAYEMAAVNLDMKQSLRLVSVARGVIIAKCKDAGYSMDDIQLGMDIANREILVTRMTRLIQRRQCDAVGMRMQKVN